MRLRIGIALFLALFLIASAGWLKSHSGNGQPASIIAVGSSGRAAGAPDAAYYPTDSAGDTSNEPLSTTDLVSRQLVLDYLNLESNGQATPENLSKLVDNYISSVPSLNSAPSAGLSDLSIVPDSPQAFRTYDNLTTDIENERLTAVNSLHADSSTLNISNPDFPIVAGGIASAYRTAALSLEKTAVPSSLASMHLELVNNYLSTASGMEAIAAGDKDSITAFAGMVTVNANIAKEKDIVSGIIAVLIKNGL